MEEKLEGNRVSDSSAVGDAFRILPQNDILLELTEASLS